jgi:hypothetical protein
MRTNCSGLLRVALANSFMIVMWSYWPIVVFLLEGVFSFTVIIMIVYYYSELLTDLSFYILRCRCSSILKRECGVQRRPLDSIDGDVKTSSNYPTDSNTIVSFSETNSTKGQRYRRILWRKRVSIKYTYSQTCLSDSLCITTSFVIRPYLFLPSIFLCIWPLYNDYLSNATKIYNI